MDIVVKSKAFAVKIVRLYNHLTVDKKEYILSQQVLKCGTRIGANIHAAVCGQGTTDFAAKMKSSLSEASETEYWLELLKDTGYLSKEEADSILKDCVELINMLASITKIVTISDNQATVDKQQHTSVSSRQAVVTKSTPVNHKQTPVGSKQQATVSRIWQRVSKQH